MARMELPVLEKFCFIFDLRTGCFVMGFLHLITTLLMASLLICFASDLKQAEAKREDDSSLSVVYTIVIMIVALLCFKFMLNLGFIYAVHQDKYAVMKKYCIIWVIFLVLFAIGLLKTVFHMTAWHVIALIIYFGEIIYFVIVIRSYLISINEGGGVL